MRQRKTKKSGKPAFDTFPKSEPAPGREVFYGRVSTDEQDPGMQIDAAKRRGIPEDLIFVDYASGKTMRRPQFQLALRALERGSRLVVWKMDRLGRDVQGVLNLQEELERDGIGLVSLTEPIDTSTAIGRTMFRIQAVFAQMEREVIAERTMAGMARFRANGGRVGRRTRLSPEQFKQIEKMLLHSPDISIAKIGKKFGLSASAVNQHFPGWRSKTTAERKAWRKTKPLPVK